MGKAALAIMPAGETPQKGWEASGHAVRRVLIMVSRSSSPHVLPMLTGLVPRASWIVSSDGMGGARGVARVMSGTSPRRLMVESMVMILLWLEVWREDVQEANSEMFVLDLYLKVVSQERQIDSNRNFCEGYFHFISSKSPRTIKQSTLLRCSLCPDKAVSLCDTFNSLFRLIRFDPTPSPTERCDECQSLYSSPRFFTFN